jgi:hypothetical protein
MEAEDRGHRERLGNAARERSYSDNEVDDAASDADASPMAPRLAVSGELVDSRVSLDHLSKFVDFIETHIVPLFQRAAGTSHRKFRFNDLWMIFQPVELLYVPLSSDSPQSSAIAAKGSSTKMYQAIWRIYGLAFDAIDENKPDDIGKPARDLDIHVYYLDYDGISYCPVRRMFTIPSYDGERDITSFEIFPLRFVKDPEKIKVTHRTQGVLFRDAVTKRHLAYGGWTLSHGPNGDCPKPLAVEHIEGDVMIDFVEGYKSEPLVGFEPLGSYGLLGAAGVGWLGGFDDLHITHWKSAGNGAPLKKVAAIRERTQRAE